MTENCLSVDVNSYQTEPHKLFQLNETMDAMFNVATIKTDRKKMLANQGYTLPRITGKVTTKKPD